MNATDTRWKVAAFERSSPADLAREILGTRVDGADVEIHIRTILGKVVADLQEAHALVLKARRQVEEADGQPTTDRMLVQAVLKVVEDSWGSDAMTVPLARAIGVGDYI